MTISVNRVKSSLILGLVSLCLFAQSLMVQAATLNSNMPWSQRVTEQMMTEFPQPWLMRKSDGEYKWSYTHGLVLKGVEELYRQQPDESYFEYIKSYADHFIDKEGEIATFTASEYNIDSINAGKMLFLLYEKTGDQRYKVAIQSLRDQLDWHPRTTEGGFWHKLKYPWQLWLDGSYMAGPFYAQYEVMFGEDEENLDDIVSWYRLLEKRTRDDKTGLLYRHGLVRDGTGR